MARFTRILLLICSYQLFFQISYSQNITIKDIVFRDGYYYGKTSDSTFRFIYRIASKNKNISTFRKIDFDTRLNIIDTALISLGGTRFTLPASASSSAFTAIAFLNKEAIPDPFFK